MAKEYIEREAVVKELQEELDYESLRYTKEQNKYIDIGLGIALRTVKRLPAADVAEVKHGRWVDRYNGEYANPLYECSECKGTALYKAEVDVLDKEQFVQALSVACPHCGAKMDGKRVALEEVVDIDAQTQRNNAAMRRVIDFVMDGGNER